MKRLVIITCLIFLCACAKNENKQNEYGTQPSSSAYSQAITEIKETPPMTPSTVEQSTPSVAVKEELPQSKEEIKEPLSLNEWIVGQSFTDVKSRIPKSATIEYDSLWGEYSVV